jgi:putative endonuclease
MVNKRLIGKVGELIASKYLVEKGFAIICKNWTCRWGELDLIAEKDNMITFVEVKYRTGPINGHPSEAMTYYKRKSLQRSINMYLAKNYVTKPWRVDLLCVSKNGKSLRVDYYEYISLL